jgi:hypothetical protein
MFNKVIWDQFKIRSPEIAFSVEEAISSYEEKNISFEDLKIILSDLPENIKPNEDDLFLELWIVTFVQKVLIGL